MLRKEFKPIWFLSVLCSLLSIAGLYIMTGSFWGSVCLGIGFWTLMAMGILIDSNFRQNQNECKIENTLREELKEINSQIKVVIRKFLNYLIYIGDNNGYK